MRCWSGTGAPYQECRAPNLLTALEPVREDLREFVPLAFQGGGGTARGPNGSGRVAIEGEKLNELRRTPRDRFASSFQRETRTIAPHLYARPVVVLMSRRTHSATSVPGGGPCFSVVTSR